LYKNLGSDLYLILYIFF